MEEHENIPDEVLEFVAAVLGVDPSEVPTDAISIIHVPRPDPQEPNSFDPKHAVMLDEDRGWDYLASMVPAMYPTPSAHRQ